MEKKIPKCMERTLLFNSPSPTYFCERTLCMTPYVRIAPIRTNSTDREIILLAELLFELQVV